MIQAGKHQPWLLACPFPYPCQIRCHCNCTPGPASAGPVSLLSRTTNRGDLRSAGTSRLIAMPLRLTGPHPWPGRHSRRGHLLPSFYIGQDTRVLPLRLIPQEHLDRRSPGCLPAVAWLDAVLDPGVPASRSSLSRSPPASRGTAPWWKGSARSQNTCFSGLRFRFRATPFTSPRSLI
jgi:hypothetical protein